MDGAGKRGILCPWPRRRTTQVHADRKAETPAGQAAPDGGGAIGRDGRKETSCRGRKKGSAMVVSMAAEPMAPDKTYTIKHATRLVSGHVKSDSRGRSAARRGPRSRGACASSHIVSRCDCSFPHGRIIPPPHSCQMCFTGRLPRNHIH